MFPIKGRPLLNKSYENKVDENVVKLIKFKIILLLERLIYSILLKFLILMDVKNNVIAE